MAEGIQKTTDYSIFKTIKGNRNLNQTHLANLTVSIMQKNMLKANPIIVNSKMEIIDGQHRLEVARNNNLPVYYVVLPEGAIDTVIQLNANIRKWSAADYINSYVIRGNENYIWLYDFIQKYEISLSQALIFLFGTSKSWGFKVIRNGELRLTEPQKEIATDRADMFFEVRPFINKKGEISKSFVKAIVELYDKGSLRKVINNIKSSGKQVIPAIRWLDAVKQLEQFT